MYQSGCVTNHQSMKITDSFHAYYVSVLLKIIFILYYVAPLGHFEKLRNWEIEKLRN